MSGFGRTESRVARWIFTYDDTPSRKGGMGRLRWLCGPWQAPFSPSPQRPFDWEIDCA